MIPIVHREKPHRYRLETSKCKKCHVTFPTPRLVCVECGSQYLETVTLPKQGKILTYTVIRVAPKQFVDQQPYAVCIATLEDGTKHTAQLVDVDVNNIKVGMQVRLVFRLIQSDGKKGVLAYGHKFVPVLEW